LPARYVARVADNVELEIPLTTRFASTVRAVAAAVSADLGFSVDEIDDLRLAVNEAVSLLADVDDAVAGRLRVEFESEDGVVIVRCVRIGVGGQLSVDDVDVLARRILDAVVDEYSVDDGTFTVVKRLATLAS
jgi:serine/threonine-protein kinase RsbW